MATGNGRVYRANSFNSRLLFLFSGMERCDVAGFNMIDNPYDWSAVMLVHRWKKPLVLGDRRIRIVVGSPRRP